MSDRRVLITLEGKDAIQADAVWNQTLGFRRLIKELAVTLGESERSNHAFWLALRERVKAAGHAITDDTRLRYDWVTREVYLEDE